MAQGTITVKNNDGADDFVTLTANNLAGGQTIAGWDKRRLNSTDAGQPATVELDSSGFCKVAWYSERTDGSASRGSSADEVQPDGGMIFVSAT
jgi:hypothetical protein